MKKTLFRYIFSETCIPFLLGLVVFTFVLLMGRLLKLAEMVTGKGVPATDVLLLIVYVIPSFCLVTIPMAFLLSVLLGFGRLSSDGEITAMKASGISLYGLLPPLLAFAFLAYTATMFVTVYALPWGQMSFKNLRYELVSTKGALLIRERVFNDDFPGVVIYVDRYDESSGNITGIMIHDERTKGEPSTILAKTGMLTTERKEKALRLRLTDGTIHRPGAKRSYRLVQFGTYDLEFKLEQNEGAKIDHRDMSIQDLSKAIVKAPEKKKRILSLEYHRRFALPFACFVFAILGLPLAVRQNRRSGKSSGFSLSILILLIYYILLTLGMSLGEQGTLPALPAAWLANICLLIPGIVLFRRAANEMPFPTLTIDLRKRQKLQ